MVPARDHYIFIL